MRKIKFRCWDKKKKRFLRPHWEIEGIGGIYYEYGVSPPDQYVMQQYTGLHDKHGTEIYEGDIVQNDEMSEGAIGIIEFEDGCFLDTDNWYVEDNKVYANNCEVIGNIYENEGLLNES